MSDENKKFMAAAQTVAYAAAATLADEFGTDIMSVFIVVNNNYKGDGPIPVSVTIQDATPEDAAELLRVTAERILFEASTIGESEELH